MGRKSELRQNGKFDPEGGDWSKTLLRCVLGRFQGGLGGALRMCFLFLFVVSSVCSGCWVFPDFPFEVF